MEQSLADRGDGEELIDTKVGGMHVLVNASIKTFGCIMEVASMSKSWKCVNQSYHP